MKRTAMSMVTKFISGFGRVGEPVEFISAERAARKKARQYARMHGGRVYRAVAVGRVISENQALNLGSGYIVAASPPIEFVYWKKYYARIMNIQDMSERDRNQYVRDVGVKVFENRKKFLHWFKSKNRALGNITPVSLMKTKSGAEKILEELGRIEYGVFA